MYDIKSPAESDLSCLSFLKLYNIVHQIILKYNTCVQSGYSETDITDNIPNMNKLSAYNKYKIYIQLKN